MTRVSRRRHEGFTLLELLVALGVAGLVLMVVGQTQRLGLRAVGRQAVIARDNRELRNAASAIRGVLEQMDPGTRAEPEIPLGRGDRIALVSRLAVPGEAEPSSVAAELEADPARRLMLRWWPLAQGAPSRETLLASDVARMELSYRGASTGVWTRAWSGPGTPALVRVRLVWADPARRPWPDIVVAPLRPLPRD